MQELANENNKSSTKEIVDSNEKALLQSFFNPKVESHKSIVPQQQERLVIKEDDLTIKNLDCGNEVEHHDDLISEEADGMLGVHSNDALLPPNEVSIPIKAYFVFNETSYSTETCHNIRGYVEDDDQLVVKVPICAKTTDDVLPKVESFIFNEKAESDMFDCENRGQPIEEPCHSENGSDVCDEINMPWAGASHDEILLEKFDDSAKMLKDAFLNEEEDIMQKFLSSLKPNLSSQADSGIHLDQVENETSVNESIFQSSMHGFSDIDCRSTSEKCNDTFEKKEDIIHCMLHDSLFLGRSGDVVHSGLYLMLEKASFCLEIDHDIKSHMQKVSINDNISRYHVSFLEETSIVFPFQFEMKSYLMSVKDQFSSQKECYDELWLFGKEWLVNILICAFKLWFSTEDAACMYWFSAAQMRHDLLLRKGYYFSQSVNGFT